MPGTNPTPYDIKYIQDRIGEKDGRRAMTRLKTHVVNSVTSLLRLRAAQLIPGTRRFTLVNYYRLAAKLNPDNIGLMMEYVQFVPKTDVLAYYLAWAMAVEHDCAVNLPPAYEMRKLLRQGCTLDLSVGAIEIAIQDFVGVVRLLDILTLRVGRCKELPAELTGALCTAGNVRSLKLTEALRLKTIEPLMGMRWLRFLSLQSLIIENLPDSLCDLSQLVALSLDRCSYLQALPVRLGNLSSLEVLRISICSITALPESVGKLYKLAILHLDDLHGLRLLPFGLGNLSDLNDIHIHNCFNLADLPKRHDMRTACRIKENIRRRDHCSKILVLLLIARRRKQQCLPHELWRVCILDECLE